MDLAYTANGHVYHTNYDTPAAVTPGSIQRAGDNILALIKGIVNSPYLADPGEYRHGAVVFFDFLGIIMVHYPERISLVINVLTAFVVVLCLIRTFLGFPGKKDVKKGKKMFSTVYSQLSLRQTPLGPALSVHLIESQIKGVKKGRDQL